MTKHEHIWKLSYSMKTKEGTTITYMCEECKKFKTEKGELIKDRLSSMGGKFSTNWKA